MISTTYDPGFWKKFGHLTKSVIFHSEVCRKKPLMCALGGGVNRGKGEGY